MSTTVQQQAIVPAGTWHADPVHSDLGFAVDYMAGTFRGTFSRFEASLAEGELRGSAEVASVQVKDENLEAHLQSPEFFDAERHPQLTFASRELERRGDEVTIRGELTMKGHTEQVELRGAISAPITDPYGKERFGVRVETTVDRTAFGLDWNAELPTGEPALSNEVTLTADLQLFRGE
jgi:polyisoprenoid-binding protein YceI